MALACDVQHRARRCALPLLVAALFSSLPIINASYDCSSGTYGYKDYPWQNGSCIGDHCYPYRQIKDGPQYNCTLQCEICVNKTTPGCTPMFKPHFFVGPRGSSCFVSGNCSEDCPTTAPPPPFTPPLSPPPSPSPPKTALHLSEPCLSMAFLSMLIGASALLELRLLPIPFHV